MPLNKRNPGPMRLACFLTLTLSLTAASAVGGYEVEMLVPDALPASATVGALPAISASTICGMSDGSGVSPRC